MPLTIRLVYLARAGEEPIEPLQAIGELGLMP